MKFTIGIKKEMTQVYEEDGTVVPVTILDIGGVVVVGFKTKERDGYNAIILGKGQKRKTNKALMMKYKKLGFVPKYVSEFKVEEIPEDVKVGQRWDLNFDEVKKVKVTGKTKGKGFAGVVKRWGFAGGPRTHGQSDRLRAPGSIGAGTTPGRVFKGMKMAGHMGDKKKTVKNLKFVKFIKDKNLVLIKGAVMGGRNNVVLLHFD